MRCQDIRPETGRTFLFIAKGPYFSNLGHNRQWGKDRMIYLGHFWVILLPSLWRSHYLAKVNLVFLPNIDFLRRAL